MHGFEYIKIALWNIYAFKQLSRKLLIGFSTVILLLFCLFEYKETFGQQLGAIENEYQTNCYLEKFITSENWNEFDKEILALRQQKSDIQYIETSVLANISLISKEENDFAETLISHAHIDIDGCDYRGNSEILSGIMSRRKDWNTDKITMGLWQNDSTAFPSVVVNRFAKENEWFRGRMPEREREVILSDFVLEEFGIAKAEQEELIGKEITLYLGDTNMVAFEKYCLTGIFSVEILSEREKHSMVSSMQHIYINMDTMSRNKYVLNGGVIRYYIDGYENLLASSKKAEKVDDMISISTYGNIYEVMSKQLSAINEILGYIIIGFVFSVTIYLLCIMYFFFQQNHAFTFMLRAIGMQRRCVNLIIFWELLFFLIISMIIGVYFGTYVLYGLKYLYSNGLFIQFKFHLFDLLQSAFLAFAYCIIVCGCFWSIYYLKHKNEDLAISMRSYE